MASMKGPYTDFEIVWAYGAPSGLKEQITDETKLQVTEAGVLHITNTAGGSAITCAPHTWKFVFQHQTLEPRPIAAFD
ncbi:Uncharacterised protein [Mycolicibacterium flavescens]|uniref:hypothetical protein n=1 Tax=Mycobacterium neumannii TaxID=2048551 RepID=UPI000F6F6347|nr:hypothetical protein [Mycobacterium neumannii]VEG40289.1 Uncharacterised protein [Mycolicibacterium flavescens]